MTRTPATASPRWFQLIAGLAVGVLAVVVAFVAFGLIRDDPIDGVTSAYR